MELKATVISPHQPVQFRELKHELGLKSLTRGSWFKCCATLVGHYVYLTGMMGRHRSRGKECTVVPILDTVNNSWRWLPCEGPSCGYASMALYDSWLYWFGQERWHGSGRGGVSRFDLNLEEWELCELKGIGPVPRLGCSMHLHERRKQLLIFGGVVGLLKQNDVHLLDLKLNRWVEVTVKGKRPVARWEHSSWLSGDEFYCFGGWTNVNLLPRDGLNVLHFGLNNVVTWSNVKEASELGFLASAKALPWGDSILLFGGSKSTFEHIASIWDSKTLTLEELPVGLNRGYLRLACAAVKVNSDIIMFGTLQGEECLRVSLEADP